MIATCAPEVEGLLHALAHISEEHGACAARLQSMAEQALREYYARLAMRQRPQR